jgi:hypothetical protein
MVLKEELNTFKSTIVVQSTDHHLHLEYGNDLQGHESAPVKNDTPVV